MNHNTYNNNKEYITISHLVYSFRCEPSSIVKIIDSVANTKTLPHTFINEYNLMLNKHLNTAVRNGHSDLVDLYIRYGAKYILDPNCSGDYYIGISKKIKSIPARL